MAELKPCPFCGKTDVFVVEGSTFRWRVAQCGYCGAQTGEVRIQTHGAGTQDEWDLNARERALAEWNTRAAAGVTGRATEPRCRICADTGWMYPDPLAPGRREPCTECDTGEMARKLDAAGVLGREAPSLTDEDIDRIQEECDAFCCESCDVRMHEFARAIAVHVSGVAPTAPAQPERFKWDQDSDDSTGWMVGPVPDGEWVRWRDVSHHYGVRVPDGSRKE